MRVFAAGINFEFLQHFGRELVLGKHPPHGLLDDLAVGDLRHACRAERQGRLIDSYSDASL